MNITINGESIEISSNTILLQLLTEHNFAHKKGIAIAVNNTVIPKAQWDSHTLQANNTILVISATKGG